MHCKKGHSLVADNLYRNSCKQCRRNNTNAYYKRLKEDPIKLAGYRATHKRRPNTIRKWDITNKARMNFRRSLQRYGLTKEQYDSLLAKQNFHCAICDESKNLHIDHCHTTGKVRGLLCRAHNLALGGFGDNPNTLQNAISYLEKNRVVT